MRIPIFKTKNGDIIYLIRNAKYNKSGISLLVEFMKKNEEKKE